jgi:hypothetical protein
VLADKYKVRSKERPFVGNKFAKFDSPNGIVELSAPHMSFDMQVRYLRNDLVKKFAEQSKAESEAKKKREAEKF